MTFSDDWVGEGSNCWSNYYDKHDTESAVKEMKRIEGLYSKFMSKYKGHPNGEKNLIRARLTSKAVVFRQLFYPR